MASKGKAVADGNGKRKRDVSDKTGRRKRKNSGVLQFFEDSAFEIDESDSSMDSLFGDDDGDDDDFLEDEIDTQVKIKSEPGKTGQLPFLPKEEEMTEEEIDKMLEERYKPGSNFVTYAEDRFETKRSIDRNTVTPSHKDPIIWKAKCMVGRERHSAFCLMQKYVDLQSLGTKLQIISAFALEHVKGAIYIEADKQSDVNEACSGLCSIYSTRVAPVPQNEVPHLFNVRSKSNSIAVGTWARVKNGKYKGDLAQVVVVNDLRKKATVKLIPRIDLQAMAAKFGGGVTSKKTAAPAPRLICSSELEEFRPLIQIRRDRDTDTYFEILDGMMLKDGYLYKKVPIDSLSLWGILPTEDELLKFEPSKNEESNDVEWLSQLYGEQKKKCMKKSDKGGGKGESSSSSNVENDFEVHDMVFFSRTGFGVIIGREKDDSFKVLKEGSEGPVVVNVKLRELKKASFDKKFTTWDRHRKTISINDTLRILEGPLEGRQGIVKQIYRGTVFLYDEVEQENGGYCSSKAQNCEKIKLSSDACKEKGGEPGSSGFDDFSSSPKSPLSPKKPWPEKDNNSNFNQGDKDGMFSVGQSLRIRVGPLKGYLCRVLALRRSDVMVKLDSQQKILTVKPEHLAAVRGKNLVVPMGDDSELAKPFDLLGTQNGSRGWMDGAGTSTVAEGWTAGGQSTERSSWAAFPSSSFSLQPKSDSADPPNSMDIDSKKDAGGSAWETKVASTQNSAWGAAVADEKSLFSDEQIGGWGKSDGGWNKATSDTVFGSSASDSWGRAKVCNRDQPGSSNDAGNWGTAKLKIASTTDSCDKKSDAAWDKGNNITGDCTSSWGNANVKNQVDSWGKGKDDAGVSKAVWNTSTATPEKETRGWGDASGGGYDAGDVTGDCTSSWGNANVKNQVDSWGKGKDDSSVSKAVWNTSTATPEKETGGWGDASGGVRSGGCGVGQGGYGGRGGSSRNACYKCGETGHMARDCSQGGVGGGNACFKCGETGHMARECSQGGGSGGNACYKCGEAGHMAKECSQGGGGGNACYKCGETGHMARECSQSGGGGNACYKCGETGHMARECNQGGGSGGEKFGRSSRPASISSNFSLCLESDSSNPLKSKDNDLNKDVGETAWSSKVAPSQNSSFVAANTEQVGGWGKSNGGWNRTSDTGFGSTTSGSWGGAKVSSGDQPGSSKDDGASWGENNEATKNQVGGWKKSDEAWDKGNVTVNSTSSWGNTNANNQADSWTKGKDGENGFNGSKAAWSTSTATPDKQTGGWGNVSAGGRSGSRGGGRGGYSGRGSGGRNACYKCGETGHMARECSQGGGGGGGVGGNACYKCGETGHMARECSQGGGGGNACYKCGDTGHMARECSWGGGGRNSMSTWSSSSFLVQPEPGSANPLKSMGDAFKKDVEDSAWATKMVQNHNSSWGAAMADDKALGKTEEVGGWGKSIGGWNKTTSDTGIGSSTSDGWGRANVTGDGQYGSPKDAEANWGKAKVKSDGPTDTSKDAAPSWGKNTDLNTNQDSGWKKSSEPWDKGGNVIGNPTSSWSSPNGKNQIDSWGNAADKWTNKEGSSGSKAVWNTSRSTTEKETGGWGNDAAPSWGKNNDAITNQDGGGWKKSIKTWDKGNNEAGNPISSWSNPNVKNQEDSWGNAVDKWNSKESSCRSKAVWNSSGATTEKEAWGWSNVSGGVRSEGRSGGQVGYGGRGGGGNACYKCGEAGHVTRDCSQGGGRSGGRGGGNGCYKCGEQGHFARECPSSNS